MNAPTTIKLSGGYWLANGKRLEETNPDERRDLLQYLAEQRDKNT